MQRNQGDPRDHAEIEIRKAERIEETGKAGEQEVAAGSLLHGAYINERTDAVATVAISGGVRYDSECATTSI